MPNTAEIERLRGRIIQTRHMESESKDISVRIAHRQMGDALDRQLAAISPKIILSLVAKTPI
ncbi:hypothetical protein M9980_07265 [Sphingomonas donggukensis]|uniref:Uncharacterized protein n=1 Tax=Sphingomonas donggukensis TaxID=2949093 RepID=A0ABY4TPT0_9SPHN|nr:hypothetical protein [Sphingomonas donggukensis]URW74393.1 hypothetical protein M9980_07265 [Sphingomonas donggukensis]